MYYTRNGGNINPLYYTRKYNIKILVETGTYTSEIVKALKYYFTQIYSIELSKSLYDAVLRIFIIEKNIELIPGN